MIQNTSGLTSEKLITEAAHRIRVSPLLWFTSEGVAELAADWLDRAAVAFPIDFSEPPRNPKDRALAMGALFFAGEIVNRSDAG